MLLVGREKDVSRGVEETDLDAIYGRMTGYPRSLEGTPFNLLSGTGIKTLQNKTSLSFPPSLECVCFMK